ncbi:hypothetical protein ACP70R_044689 [Stipagrostis hirtigluma subsp. patula]
MSSIFPQILEPLNVGKFDWCQFVVDEIKQSAIGLKMAFLSESHTLNLFGFSIGIPYIKSIWMRHVPTG